MIQDRDAMKIVHFGHMGYSDFSKTKDLSKRKIFRNRNKKWAYAQPYTPAYLSYWLLWYNCSTYYWFEWWCHANRHSRIKRNVG